MIRKTKNTIYFYFMPVLLFFCLDVSAQTYTSNGNCSDWTNGACWTVSNIDNSPVGCVPSQSAFPPLLAKNPGNSENGNSGNSGGGNSGGNSGGGNSNPCEIKVVIAHAMGMPENASFTSNYVEVVVKDNSKLTFVGDLSIAGSTDFQFTIEEGSEIAIGGSLVVSQGSPSQNTVLNIGGGGSLQLGRLDVKNRVEVNVLAGTTLVSDSELDYRGNSFAMNIYGNFQVPKVVLRGGPNTQFNTFANSNVGIEKDLDINRAVRVSVNGSSTVSISGDIIVGTIKPNDLPDERERNWDSEATNGVIAYGASTVIVCGEYPEPNSGKGTTKYDPAGFFDCIALPVEFLSFSASLSGDQREVISDWATARESESSYFEVEYSLSGLDAFVALGRVEAAGFSTEVRNYRFSSSLPPGAGDILYLRIKQVDLDGSIGYTELFPLRLPKAASTTDSRWQVFPNPTTGDSFRISYDGRIQPTDVLGARVMSFSHTVAMTASDIQTLDGLLSDTFKQVPKGMYVLELTVGTEVSRIKVVKR